jgi:hypothetical protein
VWLGASGTCLVHWCRMVWSCTSPVAPLQAQLKQITLCWHAFVGPSCGSAPHRPPRQPRAPTRRFTLTPASSAVCLLTAAPIHSSPLTKNAMAGRAVCLVAFAACLVAALAVSTACEPPMAAGCACCCCAQRWLAARVCCALLQPTLSVCVPPSLPAHCRRHPQQCPGLGLPYSTPIFLCPTSPRVRAAPSCAQLHTVSPAAAAAHPPLGTPGADTNNCCRAPHALPADCPVRNVKYEKSEFDGECAVLLGVGCWLQLLLSVSVCRALG